MVAQTACFIQTGLELNSNSPAMSCAETGGRKPGTSIERGWIHPTLAMLQCGVRRLGAQYVFVFGKKGFDPPVAWVCVCGWVREWVRVWVCVWVCLGLNGGWGLIVVTGWTQNICFNQRFASSQFKHHFPVMNGELSSQDGF